MGRKRNINREHKNTLDAILESSQTIADNTGCANEKLDRIGKDIKSIKESSASKVPIVIAIIGVLVAFSGVTVVGIIGRWKIKTESEVETTAVEPINPSLEEKESIEISPFKIIVDLEKNKHWSEKQIIGIPYELDPKMLKWINDATDYTNDWEAYDSHILYQDEDVRTENAALVGKTENFLLYDISMSDVSMLIKTSEDSYVLAEGIPSTTNTGAKPQPSILEADYDNDGDNELAIRIHLLSGTDLSIDSLLMVDKASDGCWYMFQFLYNDYLSAIYEKFTFANINKNSYFVWDGNVIDIPQKRVDERVYSSYFIGNIVSIKYSFDQILIKFNVGYDLDVYWDYSSGHGVLAKVQYQGEGKWELAEYDYYNDILESYVTRIMNSYLTGDVDNIKQECDFEFSKPAQIASEYDIVEISYNNSMFGGDLYYVEITYTVDYIDTTQHASLYIIKDNSSDSSSAMSYGLWKVYDFTIIN